MDNGGITTGDLALMGGLLHFYICIDLLDNFDYFNILGDKNLNYSII